VIVIKVETPYIDAHEERLKGGCLVAVEKKEEAVGATRGEALEIYIIS
jgi:hypothetical protein